MRLTSQPGSRGSIAAVVGCIAALVITAGASAAAAPRSAAAASAPRCTVSHLEIWLGLGLGGGTAGSTFYPLEFSNVAHSACTLNGFPGVSAVGSGGGQIGPAASRNGQHQAAVTLAAGATGHAILRVVDAGAVCSSPVTATGLNVFPPGATRSESIPFSFSACAHRAVLIIGPVRAGVGIPGFTTS
jgi:Protein of unknown function (DUF4232)